MPKISQLEAATDITASDLMQVVDIEDTGMAPSGTNKKATAQLVANNLAKIVNDGAVITANTSTDAVRITQTGSGNALVVEDSESPDNTPVVITNNGKLIIGADSPTYEGLFELNGTQSKAYGSISCYGNTSGGGELALIKTRGDSHDSKTIVNANDYLGSIYYQGTDGEKNCVAAQISSTVDGTPAEDSMPGRILFSTTPSGSVTPFERMRITSAGNVGIGTTTPTAKLNVVDSSSQDALRITQTGSGNALVVEDSANPDATPFVIDSSGRVVVGKQSVLTTTNLGTPYFQTHGTGGVASQVAIHNWDSNASNTSIIRMIKSQGGSVGTNGVLADGADFGRIQFWGDDGSDFYRGVDIVAEADGSPSASSMPGRLSFWTTADGNASPTEKMRITSAGNVGIGTSTPTGRLEVNGTGDNVVTLSGDSFVALSINSYRDSSGYRGMLLYKSARGTANSPAAVQSGDSTVTIASRPYDGITNIGTARILFLVDGTVSSGVVPQEIRFATGSTSLDVVDRVAIKSSGNIGIGTISPSSKLHVAGDLTISSTTTATSATAGTNGDVPAQVEGYLVVNINGTARKIPYYA